MLLEEHKKTQNPLVSVVITTFKGVDTVERALDSVIKQTYKNLEIIVVDDNGEGTVEQKQTEQIVKKKDSNRCIRYIAHKNNKNGSCARNTGIYASRGEFVALLDDDDCYRENKIEQQVNICIEERTNVCYTGIRIHFSDGHEKDVVQHYSGNIHNLVIQRMIHAPTSVLMFKKESALRIGGFDESFCRHQDWEFFDRLSLNESISVISDVCADRFIYGRNSAKNPKKYRINRLFYLEKMKKLINALPKQDRVATYAKHFGDIAKEYFKTGNFIKGTYYVLKSGHPIKCALVIIRGGKNNARKK